MTELLTAAQMRAIEEAAIASGDVTGLELMERAGRGVVAAIFEEWPVLAPSWGPAPKPPEFIGQDEEEARRAVVLCGPGNNGGDGFVVARLLKEAGWAVEVFLYGRAETLPPDAKVNYDRWCQIADVGPWAQCTAARFAKQPLVIDAVFGTGLRRAIAADLGDVLVASAGCRRVAVDVPSMLSSDTGAVLAPIAGLPAAELTVTFHRMKLGHVLGQGPAVCGRVRVVDIGLPSCDGPKGAVRRVTAGAFGKDDGHKYRHGHALVLCGGVGKGGAARLAARGALRVGAGLVTLGCPPAALIENAAQLTAIMLRRVKDADALAAILADARINALCLGPGMGVCDDSRDLIEAGLQSGRAMVLDADALTLIGRDAALFDLLHENCVLTPHAGEFTRLFADIAITSKVEAAREAARRAGCVVLFKGPDTVIAAPDGRCSINASVYERRAPWIATAGSGDVLAGFITGLLARGFAPLQAAESGAWLHTQCALSFGPGLIAEDITEELPKVFRALGV